ncbi:hypothetical protein P153DRAFT_425751 [Dothidotthia symphoricarpi CBS 119687]|uniref:Spindle pole body component n=1 Tax=Dothidotthia symphoricarpi CBS 119687 TaxID=1392245 RepID=A0A6A6A0F5_9PLEO|nr:uncharacterized protein P153DRAFT_425751 [Dothidotthia symphoricarpi CBS 119687]KAF2125319.1 hypothetical protein P153DRAFT_425751 [Dothidotthia symphoricarpi CBS 119687]
MAQNAKMSGLTDELVHSILKFNPETNKIAYRHAQEIASRGLRGYQYARTNQFDVETSFTGLDEKFRVKNRDDLADALRLRLQKLEETTGKFKPEFLSLLLQLSDRPLENTKVEALELLRPPSPPLPETWAEIIQEEPYSDEEIWKDIDYAEESSGDEQVPKEREKPKPKPPHSFEEDDLYDPESCVVTIDVASVQELEVAQFWKMTPSERGAKVQITELQAIRETLYMLAGLQTASYERDKQQNTIRVSPKYNLNHAIPVTVGRLLQQFAGIGQETYRLRQWAKKSASLPLIQTFKAIVRKRLMDYDQTLSRLQQHYLTPDNPISVSLLELCNKVQCTSTSLLRLAQIVSDVEPQLLVNPFSHLEALFNQTTLAQMTLEKDVFEFLSRAFFECLQTYLKPIRRWMEAGELGANDETFFVFESDSGSDASSLWHDRFVLRRDARNELRSPTFFQPAAKKIFNTGKSVVFLKQLGIYGTGSNILEEEPRLDHEHVCGLTDDLPLSPFPELFQAAFETWIRSKYSLASMFLREHLFESSGLMHVLSIFETLYLGRNGAIFEDFANAIFERMDAGHRGWNDRYMLTELTREILSTVLSPLDKEKIVVRSTKSKTLGRSVKGLATVSIDYALPWQIQNIIQRASIPIYQSLFTFLLQTYRVKYLLQRIHTRNASRLTHKLQHRLIWFADMLRSYLTETVIFFTTQDMHAAMQKAEDIDDMAHIHVKYVAKLQERAMLSQELTPIHKAIVQVLDLGVLFEESVTKGGSTPDEVKVPTKKRPGARRKSSALLLIVPDSSSDDEPSGNEAERVPKRPTQQSPATALQTIDREFARLVPFITAGLRSVGRVGAESMWEQLAERLEWEGKRDRV